MRFNLFGFILLLFLVILPLSVLGDACEDYYYSHGSCRTYAQYCDGSDIWQVACQTASVGDCSERTSTRARVTDCARASSCLDETHTMYGVGCDYNNDGTAECRFSPGTGINCETMNFCSYGRKTSFFCDDSRPDVACTASPATPYTDECCKELDPDYTQCSSGCTDLDSDPDNCGTCGNVCTSGCNPATGMSGLGVCSNRDCVETCLDDNPVYSCCPASLSDGSRIAYCDGGINGICALQQDLCDNGRQDPGEDGIDCGPACGVNCCDVAPEIIYMMVDGRVITGGFGMPPNSEKFVSVRFHNPAGPTCGVGSFIIWSACNSGVSCTGGTVIDIHPGLSATLTTRVSSAGVAPGSYPATFSIGRINHGFDSRAVTVSVANYYEPGVCGNGIVETGELCDGNIIPPSCQGMYEGLPLDTFLGCTESCSCISKACSGSTGTRSCNSDCTLDTSRCIAPGCGNDICDAYLGEQCDGSDFCVSNSCVGLGYSGGGSPSCFPDGHSRECQVDASACTYSCQRNNPCTNQGEKCCDGDGNLFECQMDFEVTVSSEETGTMGEIRWIAHVNSLRGDSPFSYSWSGSDGLSGTGQSITMSYPSPGTKTASVTVTDSSGHSVSEGYVATATATAEPEFPVRFVAGTLDKNIVWNEQAWQRGSGFHLYYEYTWDCVGVGSDSSNEGITHGKGENMGCVANSPATCSSSCPWDYCVPESSCVSYWQCDAYFRGDMRRTCCLNTNPSDSRCSGCRYSNIGYWTGSGYLGYFKRTLNCPNGYSLVFTGCTGGRLCPTYWDPYFPTSSFDGYEGIRSCTYDCVRN
ncbi:MAG: PKD domain-containing protein [bacterium]|nr:PKD domain-containing protein [bacterium]